MKHFVLIVMAMLAASCATPQTAVSPDVAQFQKELNELYRTPEKSPLRGSDLSAFRGHPFFPVNPKFHVTAHLERTKNAAPFEIPTSSGRTKTFVEYGKAHFTLDGKAFTLNIYQNRQPGAQAGHENDLFLPFRDATNGHETYGGGKYMDLKVPSGKKIILDFNKSYQPYCAYNAYDYSCPIVPEENALPVRIEAGVKMLPEAAH